MYLDQSEQVSIENGIIIFRKQCEQQKGLNVSSHQYF